MEVWLFVYVYFCWRITWSSLRYHSFLVSIAYHNAAVKKRSYQHWLVLAL